MSQTDKQTYVEPELEKHQQLEEVTGQVPILSGVPTNSG